MSQKRPRLPVSMRLMHFTALLTLIHGVSSGGGVAGVASRVLEALPEWEAAADCECESKLAKGADGECACKGNGSGCLPRNRLRMGAGVAVDSKGRRPVGVGVNSKGGGPVGDGVNSKGRRPVGVGVDAVAGRAGIEFLCEEGNLDDPTLGGNLDDSILGGNLDDSISGSSRVAPLASSPQYSMYQCFFCTDARQGPWTMQGGNFHVAQIGPMWFAD